MIDQQGHIAALMQGARPEVVNAIRQASARTGVDFAYLLEKAAAESSFDPNAQASTSSARGLYQFLDKTWLDTLDRHATAHGMDSIAAAITRDSNGNPVVNHATARQSILDLRDNPRVSALMAAEFAQDNKATLEQSLGREVGNTELYMAHFLGAGGAAKFLSHMDTNSEVEADYIVPAAARANQAVFYENGKALSLNEVFARFEGKFGEPPAGQAPQARAMAQRDPSPRVQAMPQAVAVIPEAPAITRPQALKAAIIAAPDPAFAALRTNYNWQHPSSSAGLQTDVAMQMMALTLLDAFSTQGDENGNKPNEWIV